MVIRLVVLVAGFVLVMSVSTHLAVAGPDCPGMPGVCVPPTEGNGWWWLPVVVLVTLTGLVALSFRSGK